MCQWKLRGLTAARCKGGLFWLLDIRRHRLYSTKAGAVTIGWVTSAVHTALLLKQITHPHSSGSYSEKGFTFLQEHNTDVQSFRLGTRKCLIHQKYADLWGCLVAAPTSRSPQQVRRLIHFQHNELCTGVLRSDQTKNRGGNDLIFCSINTFLFGSCAMCHAAAVALFM